MRFCFVNDRRWQPEKDREDAGVLYSQLDHTLVRLKRLEEENARLKQANHVLTLRLGIYCRSDFAALPPEILLIIFRNALPPPWMLTGSKSMLLYPTDVSAVDLHIKHTLLSVCKSWHGAGTELLYETVTFRRITQLPVFVRALEGRAGLGCLVKHLNLDCFVPRGYSKLYEHESKRILELCPNLSHVGFSPPFWTPVTPPFPAMNPSITSLEFSSDIPYAAILPVLVQHCSSLKSLVITIPAAVDGGHPILTFTKLEDLRLTLELDSAVSGSNWRTPNLRRLWLSRSHVEIRFTRDAELRRTEKLLDTYGRTLTFLRLTPFHALFQSFLDRCPALEHLVTHHIPVSIKHPVLKYIDVFMSYEVPDQPTSWTEGLPSLRRYRRLDSATSILRDIPLPPDDGATRDHADSKVQTSSIGVASTHKNPDNLPVVLGFNDRVVNGPLIHWTDHGDGPHVVDADTDDEGSSDSEGSDMSDSGWGTDVMRCDLDNPLYEEEDWQIGHDEAIEMFYRTRESQT
ncbi:hypothetical protein DFH06DRAFT_432083 [Mycena polygramma]|nr:hypothetical protein DFH06DRAFT_432083 [Mycena polygramma]